MAYTTINKSSEHFNTKLYSGTGSTNNVTGVGFQPDWTWIKSRTDTGNHRMYDAVRGATKTLYSNLTNEEGTNTNGLSSFNSDGFTVNTNTQSNGSGNNFVSWNWKAGGSGSSNTDGSITSTVSANTTAGFSIVKYTGTGSASDTIGHGLGVKPAMVIMRPLGYSGAWWIIHKDLTADNVLEFNTNAQANISSFGGGGLKYSTFTTSVIGGGNGSTNSDLWNKSGEDYIAYCFAEKTGYSKFGSYVGNNGGSDGVFVYTGFKPTFVMVKLASHSGANWNIKDVKRDTFNPVDNQLRANLNNAEGDGEDIDILSNGFKTRANGLNLQDAGYTYIYMAFGQSLVGSNNIPCTAR